MQSKIIVFCGKGGVGKTTLSLSMALRCAERGKKVVVVSSHPLPELAIAVSLEGLAETFPTGPLASAGAELARFFSNASNITLLPVTTLEEMANEETIEMCARVEA